MKLDKIAIEMCILFCCNQRLSSSEILHFYAIARAKLLFCSTNFRHVFWDKSCIFETSIFHDDSP